MNEVFSKARYLVDYLLDDHKQWGLQAWFYHRSSSGLNGLTLFISVEIMWKSSQNEGALESAGADAFVSSAQRSFRGYKWFHRLGCSANLRIVRHAMPSTARFPNGINPSRRDQIL
jgi:hypothetical protein